MSMAVVGILMFVLIIVLILLGYPVAFVLGGVSTLFGVIFLGIDFFLLLPSRFMGVLSNKVLMAVPLFVFMGVMFEKSGMAARLLTSMSRLFGKLPGGLAISTLIVGVLLAASTGIVGATVITMGLISLPVMLKQNYDPKIATGIIVSSGTLGQIIPPSIVLVLLGSVLNISVGDLFKAAIIPSILLVLCYLMYILALGKLFPDKMPVQKNMSDKIDWSSLLLSLFAPLLLILLVLGSIFLGIASPTEAAAIGALGSILITIFAKKFTLIILKDVMRETTLITSMVFFILLGATTFSLVLRGIGADSMLTEWITHQAMSPTVFLLVVMLMLFVAGFFIDFIEIIFIFLPVLLPIFNFYDFNLIWIAILIALNLQTSFLTPPFGFALFYLKGVCPDSIQTKDIYKGVIPFLIIQVFILMLILFFPSLILN